MPWAVIFHSNLMRGALAGVVSAASTDLLAFKSWHSWHDAIDYSWSLATFRWAQGAVLGALVGSGYGLAVGA